jgi:probable HAF family extracellular repeat protein
MKSKKWTSVVVMTLFAALAMSVSLTAQQQIPTGQPKYTVIDMGTLGGPQSNVTAYAAVVSSQQAMVGGADTSTRDPNYPNFNYLLSQDPFVQHAVVTQYGIRTDLGTLPGGNSSFAYWVNASGTVVGISENGAIDPLIGIPEGNAVMWKNGQITNLGTLGGNESGAYAVNASGQVTGAAANAVPDNSSILGWGTQTRAFLYQNGIMKDIGTLGGTDAIPYFMNDAGQVAGFSYTASGAADPFIWTNGNMKDLGTLGGTFGYVNALNSTGQAAGTSNIAGDGTSHAFFWDGSTLHDLGSIFSFHGGYSVGMWINDAGAVVGQSQVPSTANHAVLWKNGATTDLGVLPGDTCSIALSINSSGQAVGQSGVCGGLAQHAVLWQNGQMFDLSNLRWGVKLIDAFYITDSGAIAAVGNLGGGGNGVIAITANQHAFLLVPFGSDGKQEDVPAAQDLAPDTLNQVREMVRQRFHTNIQPE